MRPDQINNNQLQKRITGLVHAGRNDEAFRIVIELSKTHPDNPVVWYMLAGLHANTNNTNEMINCCIRVIELDPGHAGAHFNLGAAYHRVGRLDDSFSEYKHCIKIEPGNSQAINGLGKLHLSRNEPEFARECFFKLLHDNPNDTQLLINIGLSYSSENNHSAARTYYIRALASHPGSAEASYLLGSAWQSSGDLVKATNAYHDALKARPDYQEALNNLGHVLTELGKLHEAETIFKRMISLYPDSAEGHNNLGIVYDSMGDFENAETYYRKAISLNPSFIITYCHLGYMLSEDGKGEQALQLFNEALSISPRYGTAIAGKAATLERLGKFKEAANVLEPEIIDGSNNPDVILAYCKIALRLGNLDQAIELSNSILSTNNLPEKGKSDINRMLGDLYDKKNKPELAFRHYKLANELSACTWQHRQHVRYIDRIIKYTQRDPLSHLPRATHHFNGPVFIVGMPRSGTSLVEQILASHPDVFGAGELRFIGDIISSEYLKQHCKGIYPEAVAELNQENVNILAQKYIRAVEDISPDVSIITDKMPHNFLYLGLIELLLPQARVIHIKRNPLDNCLSLYFQGFNPMHSYSTDFSMLGKYYTQYTRLMQHWQTALNIPILEICYEDIIKDTEHSTRRLLDFCGLSWSEQCLNFHESGRFVKTPSYDQVRQPIYSSSIGRWKNYQQFIDPLRKGLETES